MVGLSAGLRAPGVASVLRSTKPSSATSVETPDDPSEPGGPWEDPGVVRQLRAQGSGLQFSGLQQLPVFVGLQGASWGAWPGGCWHLSWREAHFSPEGRAETAGPGARTAGLTWDPDRLLSFLSPHVLTCEQPGGVRSREAFRESLQGFRLVIHS